MDESDEMERKKEDATSYEDEVKLEAAGSKVGHSGWVMNHGTTHMYS